ncbi:MAG: AAA family ATPase [Clostridiales bacterium]|nr:AAA family ATPase [Clostridiales bacterium]MBR2821343.1 AAA family ATPase [Clostridiales bacterium]
MKKKPGDSKTLTLSVDDIGSEITDQKVTCIKVFCPRKANDFVSFLCDGRFTVAGKSKVDIVEGGTYIISGKVTEWNNRPQVTLKKITADEDAGESLIIASFLADNVKGLGKALSESLAEMFGREILKVLTETPEIAASKIKGLSVERAIEICDCLVEDFDFYEQGLEARLLGFSQAQIKLLKNLGRLDCGNIRKTPFDLMGHGIAGFDLLDRIASSEGVSEVSAERIAAAVYQACITLHEDTKSTSLKPLDVRKRAFEYANNREAKLTSEQFSGVFREAAEFAIDAKQIAVFKYDSGKCAICDVEDPDARFATMSYFTSELAIERRINQMLKTKTVPPARDESDRIMRDVASDLGIIPDRSQLDALYLCMYSPISVITGGPGTGKTTIMGVLGEYFRRNKISCIFAAPTGRAAKKLSEACGSEASTIHRLLGVRKTIESDDEELLPADRAGQYNSLLFVHGKDNPIHCRVIVIDEMSMVDTMLFRHLLDAADKGTSLILVGDPDQLPSVGCGDILRDLLSCGSIPKVKLEALHRQSDDGSIASNAGLILEGHEPKCMDKDFEVISCGSEEEAQETIVRLMLEHKEEDLICLTPTKNENVLLGTVQLNKLIQSLEVKDDLKVIKRGQSLVLHVGDKVMQNKNDYSTEWIDPVTGEVLQGIFNGELGVVTDIDPLKSSVTITFDEGKTAEYKGKMLENIDLAYSVTVHKSQGCEFDRVIIALGKMNPLLYKRSLLYTAVTRGKMNVTIVELEGTLAKFLRSPKGDTRDTCLRDLLKTVDYRRNK